MPFDPAARQIYEYYDGSTDAAGAFRRRRADPMGLYMGLMEAAGGESEYHALWGRAHQSEEGPGGPGRTPAALAEMPRLVEVARHAFGLVPFEPYGTAGLADAEVLEVLYDFCEYLEKKAWNTAGSPSSSPPTPA